MQKSLEQILNLILHSSEILEDEMKQNSDLRDLTSRQLYCIELINSMKNPSLSELADKMGIAKASLSVMIDRLEKKSYVYRVTSDNDRRSAHLHLSETGETAALLHAGLHKRISNLMTEDMTDSEKQILLVLLNKSLSSLSKLIQL